MRSTQDHAELLEHAYAIARHSMETTKVGCVIYSPGEANTISVGWNSAPVQTIGLSRDERRPYIVHAEEAALSCAGTRAQPDCTVYVTHHPCVNCLAHIALTGIKNVVYGELPNPDRYPIEQLRAAADLLGITTTRLSRRSL